MNVYPNPSNGEFVVKLGENVVNPTVEIVDLQGRVVYNNALFGSINEIPLKILIVKGNFVIKVTTNEQQVIKMITIL
ncbi:MAG: hypothetical protein ACJAZ3_000187 [Sphingobacteriales bacterium]|jgi:hypothetical protein